MSAMKRRQHISEEEGLTISRCDTQSSTSEPIPIDLIFEILLRLPAKSIARCSCVSKIWASILRRPHFTELFFTRSSNRPQLLFSCGESGELLFYSVPQVQDDNSSLVVADYHMKFAFDHISRTSKICGHARGLVCLSHLRTLKGRKETVPEICNPSTGQSLTLPKVKTRRVNVRSFFVYDQIGEKLKVLSMTWPCYNGEWICSEHQILTLGSQNLSWRMIECSTPHHPVCDGICINGCLYYQAMVGPLGSGISTVVCFDVSSEKFRFIRKGAGYWVESVLVNYNGKLGLLSSGEDNDVTRESKCIELWVLVDAEKPEWSKLIYTFPPFWKNVAPDAMSLYFVGMTGANEILLSPRYRSDHFCVFYYNFERNTIRRVEIRGMDVLKHSEVHIFLHHVEDVKLYANV